ncbi:MAG: hypothetical protein ACUVXI_03035 [bacterium]
MDILNTVLLVVLEIAAIITILIGAFQWIMASFRNETTVRSFMALIFTFVFFIVVVFGRDFLDEWTLRWLLVVYGAVMAVYIVARTIEGK